MHLARWSVSLSHGLGSKSPKSLCKPWQTKRSLAGEDAKETEEAAAAAVQTPTRWAINQTRKKRGKRIHTQIETLAVAKRRCALSSRESVTPDQFPDGPAPVREQEKKAAERLAAAGLAHRPSHVSIEHRFFPFPPPSCSASTAAPFTRYSLQQLRPPGRVRGGKSEIK